MSNSNKFSWGLWKLLIQEENKRVLNGKDLPISVFSIDQRVLFEIMKVRLKMI